MLGVIIIVRYRLLKKYEEFDKYTELYYSNGEFYYDSDCNDNSWFCDKYSEVYFEYIEEY